MAAQATARASPELREAPLSPRYRSNYTTSRGTTQVPGDLRPEFDSPAPDCLIGHVDAALEQHFLKLAQAQIEPEVEPNRVGDDLRWKAVALRRRKITAGPARISQFSIGCTANVHRAPPPSGSL
jgi:hypothetical protein